MERLPDSPTSTPNLWFFVRWLFDARVGSRRRFVPRWIFLRALAAIYFSAFFSLLFQIEGLNGPHGILPVRDFLASISASTGLLRYWYVPSLFWISSSSPMMIAVVWSGLVASVTALLNLWPRMSFTVCFACFLSFVTAAQAFSSYQSDGMLLEAGFLALFFAPSGYFPRLGVDCPTSRAALFLLQWEWFRIYFESGLVKLLSGDVEWRNFTAMDEYYQNSPLPTWIGWYVEHLPHWFHAGTVAGTLAMELGIVWMLFLPRRARLICFFIVTPWEIGVILTGNYAFLNYLVLALGFLLLDDRSVRWILPGQVRNQLSAAQETPAEDQAHLAPDSSFPVDVPEQAFSVPQKFAWRVNGAAACAAAIVFVWIGYATTVELLEMQWPNLPLPSAPVTALEPLRVANQYGLFAVMTRGRYEIEFQGSNDGLNWIPYRFRFKPQALNEAPGIYAPYQPRFEWNLWFASLGNWQQNELVPLAEERLLENDQAVLALFKRDPFHESAPKFVRAVLWQYWFTSIPEMRRTGDWWKRRLMGLYAPELTRQADGKFVVVEWPQELPPHE
jgi:hypothetical protein